MTKAEKIKNYLASILRKNVSDLKKETPLQGMDSLDFFELHLECEEILEKNLPDNMLLKARTVGDVFDALAKELPELVYPD